jgi:hypothetical protein
MHTGKEPPEETGRTQSPTSKGESLGILPSFTGLRGANLAYASSRASDFSTYETTHLCCLHRQFVGLR